MTATEALLVKQRVFALPSANALVVPLSRDDQLLGLLVGEMPAGGGWKGNSARTRRGTSASGAAVLGPRRWLRARDSRGGGAERDERGGRDEGARSAGHSGEVWRPAQARSRRRRGRWWPAWAMHRRADYATAAAIRSDERVEGCHRAREPLTVLRTLGGISAPRSPSPPAGTWRRRSSRRATCSPSSPLTRVGAAPQTHRGRARGRRARARREQGARRKRRRGARALPARRRRASAAARGRPPRRRSRAARRLRATSRRWSPACSPRRRLWPGPRAWP